MKLLDQRKMNYEIAKKLKEAGFPQRGEYFYTPKEKIIRGTVRRKNPYHMIREGYYVAPTLSELIDACGVSRKDLGGKKRAFASLLYCGCEECLWNCYGTWMEGDRRYCATGKPPEEAVAKLYIALHETTRPSKEDSQKSE